MVKVKIEGYGTFQIPEDRVGPLTQWLSMNNAVSVMEQNQVQEVKNNQFTGRTLING